MAEKDCSVNVLCKQCWCVVEHKCGCPEEFIVKCQCKEPKPME